MTVQFFSVVVTQPLVDNLAVWGQCEQHGPDRDRDSQLCSFHVTRESTEGRLMDPDPFAGILASLRAPLYGR